MQCKVGTVLFACIKCNMSLVGMASQDRMKIRYCCDCIIFILQFDLLLITYQNNTIMPWIMCVRVHINILRGQGIKQ